MKIAITGATGQLGRIVVNKLKEKVSAQNIFALVRSTAKAANLGMEAREADYDKPETLNTALEGVDTLLLISGSEVGKRASQHKNVADFAEAAVSVLTGEGHQGKVYELAGDEAYTLSDLAAEISRQTGKEIPYKNLPPEKYTSTLISFGLLEGLVQSIAGWDVCASKGDLFDNSRQLSKLIGRSTTQVSVAVAEVLKGASKA